MRHLMYLVPLFLFLAMAGLFKWGLTSDPSVLPSVLINRPVPELALPPLPGRGEDTGLSTADLKGQVSLVNVFGSWCVACLEEHPFLLKLKRQNIIPIHGIDWREVTHDAGAKWLARHGDPYDRVGLDPAPGRAAVDFGVTGAPETFIVDKNGVIRYKHIGPLNQQVWEKQLLPIIQELQK